MREFISALVSPVPILFLLIITGLLLLWRKKRRAGKIMILFAGFWLLIAFTRPVPVLLVKKLEEKYHVFNGIPENDSTEVIHVLVLAAGHSDDTLLPSNIQLSLSALGRLAEGVRIYKMIPGSKLILSGPGGMERHTQADALLRTALMMGVDSAATGLLHKAKNTAGEAEEYKDLYGTKYKIILVTSAIHMPRAMMIFRKEGFDPVAAPTNFMIKYVSKKNLCRWLPDAGYAGMMDAAMHEWAGIVWEKVREVGSREVGSRQVGSWQ